MKIGKWFWKKQHKKDNEIIVANDMSKVLYSEDEWYIYYRQCTKNIRKIRSILDHFTKQPNGYSNTKRFWDELMEIGYLASIKDPEEMKEWLVYCKTIEKGVNKIYTKIKYSKYYNYCIKYKGEYYA